MARQQQEIKENITTDFITNATIVAAYGLQAGLTFLQQFSLLSLENNLFDVVTSAIWSFENILDIFREEIEALMARMRPHTQRWHENLALSFLLGVALITDTVEFDTTGMTAEEIEAAKVIKQAACVKLTTTAGYGIIRLKVASANSEGILQPVDAPALTALTSYMALAVDAGTQIQITTGVADKLRLYQTVYFDPRVLNASGQRLDGTNDTPLQSAYDQFLQSMSFNGTLNMREMERAGRTVPGIVEIETTLAATKYGGYTYDAEGVENVGAFTTYRVADGGYLVMDDLIIDWQVAP